MDFANFQHIGIDDSRGSRNVVPENCVFVFVKNLSVVTTLNFVDVCNVVDGDKLKIFHTVDIQREPIVHVLVDNATVERVFAQNTGIVDNCRP